MRLNKVRIPFLLLLAMPIFPSNGVSLTTPGTFLPDQIWPTDGRLTKLESVRFPAYEGEKSNLEWGEWVFIIERH